MENKTPTSKIVFLDRDGTINIDHGYVTKPENIDIIPGAAESLGALKRAGFICIVVSNQSAIGRGMASVQDVEKTNRRLEEALLEIDQDAKIDLMLYAPDAPDNASERRKPRTGMFRDASSVYSISKDNSWMIGDKASDIEFGIQAGLPNDHCLLVLTGKGESEREKLAESQLSFPSLLEAVDFILRK